MNAVATMNAEAARCFRRACEAHDPLDQMIFIGLRQAWLALAVQVRTMERPPLVLPVIAPDRPAAGGAEDRQRPARSKRVKARAGRKATSRTRRRKMAA